MLWSWWCGTYDMMMTMMTMKDTATAKIPIILHAP